MDTLLRFGSGDYLYTFNPEDQIQIRDNFRDVVPRTSRLPGLSGGFDEYGTDRAPNEIGNVQVSFWLLAENEIEMEAKKLALGRMKVFGKKLLFKQPEDEYQTERYTEARVNSIDFNEAAGQRPDRYLMVTVNFQCDNPFWYTIGTEAFKLGDGTLLGSGAALGGTPIEQTLTGLDNSFSLTPSGNDITYARFTIEIPATKSATNIRIQREVASLVVDQVAWAGTLVAADILEINCRALSIQKNGNDAYGADFTFITSAWFRLIGGIPNTIRVRMANASDQINLKVRFFEAYNV
jgi:hypothetical protein